MELAIGEVEIQLFNPKTGENEPAVLKPTLRAAKMISRSQGGYMGAAQRIMNLEMDTFITVINVGLGLTERGAEKLDERVWRTGMSSLAEPLVKYVHILANGGRPPKHEDEPKEGADPLDSN